MLNKALAKFILNPTLTPLILPFLFAFKGLGTYLSAVNA